MNASWDAVRERLVDAIERRRGGFTKRAVAKLAKDAGVAYTTLARFLRLVDGHTKSMHQTTLTSVAVHLGVSPNWLRHGVDSEQVGIWPHVAPAEQVSDRLDPVEELLSVVATLGSIQTESIRFQLCRTAVEAMLRGARQVDAILPLEVYGALTRLDAQLQAAERGAVRMA